MKKRDDIKADALKNIEGYLRWIGSIYDTSLMCEAMQLFINKRRACMKKTSKKKPAKVKKVMKEFKSGKLHSGSKKGPVVTNPKQAIAIALSEQRKSKGE